MKDVGVRGRSKEWISEFLFVRGLFKKADGSPLYQYQVTDDEYSSLPRVLRQSIVDIESPTYSVHWSALFCLFVAEKYRREYDGSSLGWSWSGFEKPLSIQLQSTHHKSIVQQGFEFWKRPIRKRTNGHDYLGSLFDEGGLPWRLIQSETHGFGRAVRGAIANYYRVKRLGGSTASIVENYAHYFPQTFRTEEKYLLIASIVEWLMELAEAHPIDSVENPANYLDEHSPDWRKQSPLPVSEENARNLINEWLKDAGKSRSEKKRIEADEKNFTCEHWLKGSYENWSIETEVFLPAEIKIKLKENDIQSTRLEVAFYEGENLLKRSGILHGKVNEDRSEISVKVTSRTIPVLRSQPELPLTLQLLSNGGRVHASYFEGSELDYESLPLVFVSEGDALRLISTASATIPASEAVVRIPETLKADYLTETAILGHDHSDGTWVALSDDTTFIGEEAKVILRFDPRAKLVKPMLEGVVSLYDTLPNLVYRGWPRVCSPDGEESQEFRLIANGIPVELDYQKNEVGTFQLSVIGESGETLLKRKIGVIPKDLRVMSVPASTNSPARISLRSSRRLQISLLNEEVSAKQQGTDDGYEINLEPAAGHSVPDKLRLALTDGLHPGEPVVMRLPYPKTGVQLFDDSGQEVKGGVISVDQLIEMSMTLTPRPDMREQFYVSIELICPSLPNFRRHYPFTANRQSQKLSLYAFEEDIQQMLGTTSNQDAFVRICVETDRILKQLNVVRYTARLDGPNSLGRLEVVKDSLGEVAQSAKVYGMRLDDPRASAVEVPERSSEGVGMGVYEIPPKMMRNGPWLLFAPEHSSLQFRPTVWVPDDSSDQPITEANTLHTAAKLFHPTHNPRAFEDVISEMASDFSHSGWDYLRALKEGYAALPLSAFESWKALATNSAALAVAVFRLEFDPAFCRRLSNELAVIWETVTVQTWIDVRAQQVTFLIDQGIPDEFAEKLVEDRIQSLSGTVPCFMHLAEYLKRPEHVSLQQVPYIFAQYCYGDLRRNHSDDQRWPDMLADELTEWVRQQELPTEISRLADVGFARAVAYLPIFLAAVTAGKASFDDLAVPLAEVKFGVRVLSDFDRYGWYEPTYSLVLSNLLLEDD